RLAAPLASTPTEEICKGSGLDRSFDLTSAHERTDFTDISPPDELGRPRREPATRGPDGARHRLRQRCPGARACQAWRPGHGPRALGAGDGEGQGRGQREWRELFHGRGRGPAVPGRWIRRRRLLQLPSSYSRRAYGRRSQGSSPGGETRRLDL